MCTFEFPFLHNVFQPSPLFSLNTIHPPIPPPQKKNRNEPRKGGLLDISTL